MKLNCDMGESFGAWTMGNDADVMPCIDMASIACGFHASDPVIMRNTVALAQQHGVSIGAHPSYPDLLGFGRRQFDCTNDELYAWLGYQIGALQGICRQQRAIIDYVKPHGALYNTMMKDEQVLRTVMQAVKDTAPGCPLVVMAIPHRDPLNKLANEIGIELLFEAFSDRAYDDAGFLVNRRIGGAVHGSADAILRQVQQITEQGTVTTLSGKTLKVEADTLCIHGDGPHASAVAQALGLWRTNGKN
ncbi:5-oxoprolinase subunit PxpA [Enterovibrio sp. ZSDZ42]|uniref:5-oxoprolinase subunit PxpA n=1 Tax=Enterovibrio gelatinilyticus TaxID=2899819 RepID=A0ABT5R2F1_9GAMM|nr:5-oxoprolinase subunit PxpA [Enterovibrio sp. ZSDZ42]MDD1794449.1 5-oxoprolinase subunit PxpA [Enterovibrio sp. ZSDZ42]